MFPSSSVTRLQHQTSNRLLMALGELEFKKAFLILSYLGKKKLEDEMTVDMINKLQDLPMTKFETEVWRMIGQKSGADRIKNLGDNPQAAHVYQCHIEQDGNIIFKGPYLRQKKTHLQRVLGDENLLDVRFSDLLDKKSSSSLATYCKVSQEGIIVAMRRFQFFVYKDGGKEEKKKNPTSSPVKCYFICTKLIVDFGKEKHCSILNRPIHEVRSMFMHVHTVSSLGKYMARFSLILSKTIKLEVDLASVNVELIDDILCLDGDGNKVCDENGTPLIHTDGTGFISEDLAFRCSSKVIKNGLLDYACREKNLIQANLSGSSSVITEYRSLTEEPPLLIQFRLFHEGLAVKGTVLLNKKLPQNTIQIRPSMVKVERDEKLSDRECFNSFEIVHMSNQPRNACLSRFLIAHLHNGQVPKEYFIGLLENALNDARDIYTNEKAALRVALRYGDMDDYLLTKMIVCGIPLDESYLNYRLSILMKEERKGLKGGKIPLTECYYLMGTADPTGTLRPNEVCVILENGQISGKILVYKHPGLHFGDIHVLSAKYVEGIEAIVGNAKFAIFFPTSGPRSLADEIANSDFDGDMYWVSRNPQLLKSFQPSQPWEHVSSAKPPDQARPTSFLPEQLEYELFNMFLDNRFGPSTVIGTAADSWMAYMDRLLTLGDECPSEKLCLQGKMLRLVDIYYLALDAPKSGIKVDVPATLKPEKFPHFMERGTNSYKSTSILGVLYDMVSKFQLAGASSKEVWQLSLLSEDVPQACLELWLPRYEQYRFEMASALSAADKDIANTAAEEVINKYKQMLYGGAEFEGCTRRREEILNEARAIYKIAYDYAESFRDVAKCGFAWKVAGCALCELYLMKNEDRVTCSRTFLEKVFN
ncbi:hypothetical protein H6P81_009084 [Aristolochia fimbriata]|uniref:RNA-dependent RNA polymerase n=1 Tax=Aristolochia fimbriata TaxID=158543 RepID=A0AAV7EKG8_ARIFI|nr:hypothetical protein H6P81_009084 [Aristolochia fimbriata]